MTTWIKRIQAGQSPIADSERLSPEERARERIMLGLRRISGIELSQFKSETGFDFRELSPDALSQNLNRGFLEEIEGSVRLTREGRFVADSVIVDFL